MDCLNCREYSSCKDTKRDVGYIYKKFVFSKATSVGTAEGRAIGKGMWKIFNYR